MLAVGCQNTVRLDWESPKPAAQLSPVYVGSLSADSREPAGEGGLAGETIGKHTLTFLDIPAGSIQADASTPVGRSFDRAVREGLRAAGRDPRPASEAQAGSLVLRAEIRQCHFWSSSVIGPLYFQKGEVEVALRLQRPGGGVAWHRECKEEVRGTGIIANSGFDSLAKDAMTRLVADITRECSSAEFVAAVGAQEHADSLRAASARGGPPTGGR
jgi:hypothetical protein